MAKLPRKGVGETETPPLDPILQYFKDVKEGKLKGSPPVDLTALELLLKKVDMLWEFHPALAMPLKYGKDLLVYKSGEFVLPEDPKEVYTWPWPKVQQYVAHELHQDPGEQESGTMRANVAGHIAAWIHARKSWEAQRLKEEAAKPKVKKISAAAIQALTERKR